MKKAIDVALFVVIAATLMLASFGFGRESSRLDCDHWCEVNAESLSLDVCLTCKAMCHEVAIGEVLCIFDYADDEREAELMRSLGPKEEKDEPKDFGM